MAITEKKPPLKQTVGAQYLCFNTMSIDGEWTETFQTDVEKTKVVKSVKVTDDTESADVYSSGEVYDTENTINKMEIEVEVIAFPELTLCKMRGDDVDAGGLIRSGGAGVKPFFAYGKVVKLKGGKVRYEWYPKCKLSENSNETATSEDKFKEQTDTIKIVAYPFDKNGSIVCKVASDAGMPEGLTEDNFFAKPILSPADLTSALTNAAS